MLTVDEALLLLREQKQVTGGDSPLQVWIGPRYFGVSDIIISCAERMTICITEEPLNSVGELPDSSTAQKRTNVEGRSLTA